MKTEWLILLGAGVLGVLWFLQRKKGHPVGVGVNATPLGVPPAPGTGSPSGQTSSVPSTATGLSPPPSGAAKAAATLTQGAEAAVSAYTHVPLATIGAMAQRAPAWAKVILPGVTLATDAAQRFINNPVGATKAAASTIAHDVAHPIDTVKGAGKAIGGAAKGAASAVGHAASSIGHALGSIF